MFTPGLVVLQTRQQTLPRVVLEVRYSQSTPMPSKTKPNESNKRKYSAEQVSTDDVTTLVVSNQFYSQLAKAMLSFSSALVVACIKGDNFVTCRFVALSLGLSENFVYHHLNKLCCIKMVLVKQVHTTLLYKLTESMTLQEVSVNLKKRNRVRKVSNLQVLAKWIRGKNSVRINTNFKQRGKRLRCL